MKSFVSAMAGAVLVTSGWVSAPAVAFPQNDQVTPSHTVTATSGIHVHSATAQDSGTTCHSNSSACGCALCSAARADRAASPR